MWGELIQISGSNSLEELRPSIDMQDGTTFHKNPLAWYALDQMLSAYSICDTIVVGMPEMVDFNRRTREDGSNYRRIIFNLRG